MALPQKNIRYPSGDLRRRIAGCRERLRRHHAIQKITDAALDTCPGAASTTAAPATEAGEEARATAPFSESGEDGGATAAREEPFRFGVEEEAEA